MSGKSYTMKEMKAIVEYLTEHRAYGDIKGRKMWMDLASSKVTNRTWQSLKETFLKRILTDIHNPYYKLSLTQISSFQQGQDIEARLNNKLQIRSTSQNCDTDGVKDQNTEMAETSNGRNEDKIAGEDPQLLDLRASTETLVLENCYENAEEIRKDLQSPVNGDDEKEIQPKKTMRELITYSEPLTPMLQSVLDDFVTDDEGCELKQEIIEPEEATGRRKAIGTPEITIEISDSDGNDEQDQTNTNNPIIEQTQSLNENEEAIISPNAKETEAENGKSTTMLNKSNDINNEKDSSEVKTADGDNLKSSVEGTQNSSIIIADSLLPGNQEALEEKLKKVSKKPNLPLNKKTDLPNGRKRASSEDPVQSTKRNLSKMKSISDNETPGGDLKKSEFLTLKRSSPKVGTSSNMNSEKCDSTPIQEEQAADNSQDPVSTNSSEIENPCLKNVSLYAEQFSTEKYTDSDTSNMDNDKHKKKRNIKIRNNEVDNITDKNNTKNDKKYKSVSVGPSKQSKPNSDKTSDKNKKIENTDDKIKKTFDNNEKLVDKNKNKVDKNKTTDDKNAQRERGKAKSAACQTSQDNNSDIVMLDSHSDGANQCDDDPEILGQKKKIKQQRDRALDHMFGFASDDKTQTRAPRHRKRTVSHSHKFNYGNMSTQSSDWSSDSGSEHVMSPTRPYSRKGRKSRKYVKPRPAPILSLEEEGGLFVMHGKKVYPIVKSGKLVKNYPTYMQEDDVEETFWKMKYVEEKKKTEVLTKLLNEANATKQDKVGRVSADMPTTSLNSMAQSKQEETVQQVAKATVTDVAPVCPVQEAAPIQEQKKTVKIKFTKKNQEVELEGHWSQLNPVLDHVAQLFNNEPETITISSTSSKNLDLVAGDPIIESEKSTPTREVLAKVNQRENEIAKEIERYYKEEATAPEKSSVTENNVTKRKIRDIKTPSVPSSPSKKAKLDVEAVAEETTKKSPAPEDVMPKEPPRTRGPKKLISEKKKAKNSQDDENNTMRLRRSSSRISQGSSAAQSDAKTEDEVRYKFRSPQGTNRKSYTKKSQTSGTKNTAQRKSKSATNTLQSHENIQTIAEYLHSDLSPSSMCIKEKGKTRLPLSTHSKRHYNTRFQQRTNPDITDDFTSDSSNSFQCDRIESMTFHNSTTTSEIYKSDSYRLLMNNNTSLNKHTSRLANIVEVSPTSIDFGGNKRVPNKSALNDNIDLQSKENMVELLQVNSDNENSSNMSLPTSPVLSIVENISISKTLLSSMDLDDYPTDDKLEDIDPNDQVMLNALMTPDIDVTMPLMEQECGIEKGSQDGKAYHYNLSASKTVPAVSESFLNKINSVNIDDPSLSESLNVKLRELLLESATKRFQNKNKVNIESKDEEVKDKPGPKRNSSRKRSSTPRKRRITREPKHRNTELGLLEEHTESCSRRGRQSCPPILLISDHDANETITETETAQLVPTRGRKKKDIIKVKISKPKAKTLDDSCKQYNSVNFTDSGINDTESEIKLHANDSVDLIHNHSDTCLNAHECMYSKEECMGDSIKIIDNTASTIISLDSNSTHSDVIVRHNTIGNLTQELFSSDAQDGSDVVKEFDFIEPRRVHSATTTVYHTPLGTQSSPTSIMTDDLSDEVTEEPVRNKRWYLFSDDESSNTNCFNIDKNSKAIGHGSILEQIFPVTCAVPNLSTITELSRENGDSKKYCDDTNTRDNLNSPSIFI